MAARQPNIVYILADDWGYGDVSCLNPDSRIPTPHTDALASQGMTFTDAHSNSAVCTPTRYGVLTGRYAWRGELKRGVLHGYSPALIEEQRMTAASMLQAAGYRTACIGKWHLGLGWVRNGERDDDVDFTAPLTAGPHTVGFDYSYILPASLDMAPYCYVENGRVAELPTASCEENLRPAFWRGGARAPGMQHETCLLEFTMRATQYIADHARENRDQPLFLYVPLPSPHTPHTPRKPFQGASHAGVYGDYVVEHDWSVGQIAAALERAGMAEDTLLIITSDNGAHMRGGDFDFEREFGHRSNHIYRGQKSDAWDGGHRVPFFAVWPRRIRPGSTCSQTVCLTDLMATAASLAGCSLPDDAAEDSVDFSSLLDGSGTPVRESVIHHSFHGLFAIRKGRWKLVECAGSGGWSLAEDQVADDAPPAQLYDMQADPGEMTNVYTQQADVAAELQRALDAAREADRTTPLR